MTKGQFELWLNANMDKIVKKLNCSQIMLLYGHYQMNDKTLWQAVEEGKMGTFIRKYDPQLFELKYEKIKHAERLPNLW